MDLKNSKSDYARIFTSAVIGVLFGYLLAVRFNIWWLGFAPITALVIAERERFCGYLARLGELPTVVKGLISRRLTRVRATPFFKMDLGTTIRWLREAFVIVTRTFIFVSRLAVALLVWFSSALALLYRLAPDYTCKHVADAFMSFTILSFLTIVFIWIITGSDHTGQSYLEARRPLRARFILSRGFTSVMIKIRDGLQTLADHMSSSGPIKGSVKFIKESSGRFQVALILCGVTWLIWLLPFVGLVAILVFAIFLTCLLLDVPLSGILYCATNRGISAAIGALVGASTEYWLFPEPLGGFLGIVQFVSFSVLGGIIGVACFMLRNYADRQIVEACQVA